MGEISKGRRKRSPEANAIATTTKILAEHTKLPIKKGGTAHFGLSTILQKRLTH